MTYSVRLADINEDKPTLMSLWKRNFGWITEGRYDWIYKKNPSGQPTIFLLHHDKSKSIVGAISLFPRKIFSGNEIIPAYICGDLVIDQKHRALGPVLKLLKTVISEHKNSRAGILISFADERPRLVMQKAGFEIFADICEMTQVVRTFPYVQRYLKRPNLSKALALPLDLLLRLWHMHLHTLKLAHYNIEVADSMSEQIDALWASLKKRSCFTFIGERDSHYLNWRFFESPYSKYHIFYIENSNVEVPLGYLIFSKTEKRIQIVDCGFWEGEKSLEILLSSFYLYQRSQRTESITIQFSGNSKFLSTFKRKGYSLRSKNKKIIIYNSKRYKIVSKIKSGDWYLTPADNDI